MKDSFSANAATIDWQQLTGAQLAAWQAALLAAYPSRSDLAQMLRYQMNLSLNQIAGNGNLPTVVYEVLEWAISAGRAAELLAAAYTGNPGNPAIQALPAELLRLAASTPPSAPRGSSTAVDPSAPPNVTSASRGASVGGAVSGSIIVTGDGNVINLPPGGTPVPGVAAPAAPKVAIAHLPSGAQHFVGRETELAQLDAAWADPATRIFSLVAFGGVGKSALVAEWLRRLASEGWRGASHVFGHSFYSQGAREDAQASADAFLDSALRFWGDPDPSAGSAWEKGERLAHALQRSKSLLVLDGLEPLQWGPSSGEPGKLKDPGLQALLRELSYGNPGLCLITTRIQVANLPQAPALDLERLSAAAGATLLRHLGVRGSDAELAAAANQAQGHGLTLTLLGSYLRKALDGDVRRIGEVELHKADQQQGGHARKVMEKYERWLVPAPRKPKTLMDRVQRIFGRGKVTYTPGEVMLSILRLLGLFDRPAEATSLVALRQPPTIPGLTDALVNLPPADWNYAVATLQEAGLLARDDSLTSASSLQNPKSKIQNLDAHPLIRQYFAEQLASRLPEGYRAAHRRLYEHLAAATPQHPDTLAEMMPLYHAVAHGCKAGEVQKCYDEIYWGRISRGSEAYVVRKLGAFGSDLGALVAFFEQPWQHPSSQLRAADQAHLLNQTAFRLRALSRLNEAVEPMQAGLDALIKQQNWTQSAAAASNLSELTLSLGRVAAALHYATQSIELAGRSGDAFWRMGSRTMLAEALHQAGQLPASRTLFAEAERLQVEDQPGYDKLYSIQGFQYCALLLNEAVGRLVLSSAEGSVDTDLAEVRRSLTPSPAALENAASANLLERVVTSNAEEQVKQVSGAEGVDTALVTCRAVRQRAETTLSWYGHDSSMGTLNFALDHLTLGRTYLLEAVLRAAPLDGALWQQAQTEVALSVALLRQAGQQDYLNLGLLAVAELGRAQAAVAGAGERASFLHQAERALDEVELLAGRGGMVLFQVDAAIERARLALLQGDKGAAAEQLARAQALVKATEAPYQPYTGQWAKWQPPQELAVFQPGQIVGYHRRNEEIAALLRLAGAAQGEWRDGGNF